MITVKLMGMLRLDSGIRELKLEADSVKKMFDALVRQSDSITPKKLDGCVVFINGKQGSKRSKLVDGDEVILMSPVAGG